MNMGKQEIIVVKNREWQKKNKTLIATERKLREKKTKKLKLKCIEIERH